MTVLGTDSFIRANTAGNTTISNAAGWGTSSDGQTYASNGAGATYSIDTNRGKITGTTNAINAYLGSKTSADGEILVRVTFDTSGNKTGPIVREVGNNNWYWARLTGTTIDIVKNASGTQTTIATASFTASINTAYWIRFRVVGSAQMARAWQDGTAENNVSGGTGWNVTAADTALTAAGAFGLRSTLVAATNINWFDSLYCVDYIWCDVVPASDSVLYTQTALPVEALAISDSLLSTDSASLTDANTVSDSFSGQSGFIPSDNLSITDSFVAQGSYSATEVLSALDAFLAQCEGIWVEVIPAADTMSVSGIFIPTTGLSISDSTAFVNGYITSDAIPVSDGFLGQGVYLPVEALTITDLFSGTLAPIIFSGTVAWITRDGKVTWVTRDEQATWKTRDGNITWKGRG